MSSFVEDFTAALAEAGREDPLAPMVSRIMDQLTEAIPELVSVHQALQRNAARSGATALTLSRASWVEAVMRAMDTCAQEIVVAQARRATQQAMFRRKYGDAVRKGRT